MPEKRPQIPEVNLEALARNTHYEFRSRESAPERRERRAREGADAAHQRRKDLMVTTSVLITVGVVSVVCIIVLFIPGAPPENAKWATTLLTTIVSAGLYMTGKNSK